MISKQWKIKFEKKLSLIFRYFNIHNFEISKYRSPFRRSKFWLLPFFLIFIYHKILFVFFQLKIFEKYFIHHILCRHSKIVTIFQQYQWLGSKYFGNLTIFPRNISTIFSKYFNAVWAVSNLSVFKSLSPINS